MTSRAPKAKLSRSRESPSAPPGDGLPVDTGGWSFIILRGCVLDCWADWQMVICNRSHLELFAKGLFLGSRYPNLPLSKDFWARCTGRGPLGRCRPKAGHFSSSFSFKLFARVGQCALALYMGAPRNSGWAHALLKELDSMLPWPFPTLSIPPYPPNNISTLACIK